MKVPKKWLKELVDLKLSMDELVALLPMRTISTKEVTDQFIELDMKGYNRADLLSLKGVALEVAAITNSPTTFPEIPDVIWEKSKNIDDFPKKIRVDIPKLNVEIQDKTDCPFYCLAKIDGLKIGPSPKEWVEKLEASGMRSVNNLTDVTNLIMLEYGQPLHAFNSEVVKDQSITVRKAKKNEEIITLDNKKRKLEEDDILISDKGKILGLAGVMGGKSSEIPDQGEVTVLLEAAIFNPISIRKTANRLNLTSEASKRFIHGLTKKRLLEALNSAIFLYQKLGGKLTGLNIPEDIDDPIKDIPLKLSKVDQLIGVELTREQIREYLEKLYCSIIAEKNDPETIFTIRRPYFRLDLEIEEDLIEEVARLYGYEKIPAKKLEGELPAKIDQTLFETIFKLRNNLVELGLTEVQTYSFFSKDVLDNLGWNEDNQKYLVKIANPMSSSTEFLRNNIWANLIEVVAKNLKQGFEDLAIFEVGKTFLPPQSEQLPTENFELSLALTNNTNNPIAELAAIFKKLAEANQYELGGPIDAPIVKNLFHLKRTVQILKNGEQIGGIAEIHPRVLHKFGIEKRVAVLELQVKL